MVLQLYNEKKSGDVNNIMNKEECVRIYPLRPHHGMCLAFFVGEGYSDGFTANMRGMLEKFLAGAFVRLHAGPDEICRECPNLRRAAGMDADGAQGGFAGPAADGIGEKACGKPEEKPENKNLSACASEEKVLRYDREVLSACGLKEGDVLPFEKFVQAVQEKIIETGRREKICGACAWNEICSCVKSRWQDL